MKFQVHLSNADYKFEVLDSDKKIIGNAHVESKNDKKEKFWHLEDLFIEKKSRYQGYGTELLNYLCNYLWDVEKLRIRVHPAIGQQGMEEIVEEWRRTNQQFTEEELDDIDRKRMEEIQQRDFWKEQKHLWCCPP